MNKYRVYRLTPHKYYIWYKHTVAPTHTHTSILLVGLLGWSSLHAHFLVVAFSFGLQFGWMDPLGPQSQLQALYQDCQGWILWIRKVVERSNGEVHSFSFEKDQRLFWNCYPENWWRCAFLNAIELTIESCVSKHLVRTTCWVWESV